ncbi:hypothetical protein LC613_31700 [Nostoc sphaeroides CHAB 2801]|uniref:hypothetical protein n=1 Tax=Nostoc sphaeroides TaxID=446679 RepID=UPI001E56310A|nr:hypothetical protein [Nostoc sphaeroides]MCC5632217.1 hypothetical protein [Nostoc sphaeroides CHAB 2801]
MNQHPIKNRNSPLRKLHQHLFNHNLQSGVIIPAFLQEAKARILARIRRSIQFFPSYRSLNSGTSTALTVIVAVAGSSSWLRLSPEWY